MAKTYTLTQTKPEQAISSAVNYAEELNPAQLDAVKSTKGSILCIAGAGSGKTKTLVYRVAYLIENGVQPKNILLLTFTRKAAQEMMRRASTILDDRCRQIRGGTFHGFANLMLRRFHKEAGLPQNFSIMDRSDAEDLLNLVRNQLKLGKSDSRFPKKNTLLDIFSKSVNTGKSIFEIIKDNYPQFEEQHSVIEHLQQQFQITKRQKGVLDYDDLLVELVMLLKCNNEVRILLSNESKYIMIDEYQDTNHIQADIGNLLASEHNNILAVGDDAQSIYSFRGADFRNIMEFPNKYQNCKIITLEQNYRSTQSILEFANALLQSAKEKYPKQLFSTREAVQKPVFLRPISVDDQASFIAQRALELREEGIPLSQIAVLFRASWHSNELEVELNSRNIPYVKYGGIRFTDTAHVKDITALLRVTLNPSDAVSWHRGLLLLEGIGPKNAQEIASGLEEIEAWDMVKAKYAKRKFGPLLNDHIDILNKLRENIESPSECLSIISNYYMPHLKRKYDDYTKRIDDISSLGAIADRYTNLQTFLDDLTLEIPEKSQVEAENTDKDDEALVLSTIHSAKGLEWHSVFLINLIDGHLPSVRALNSPSDIEEERRLFYVAATRAKDNLYMLCPEHNRTRGFNPMGPGMSFSEPSRFLTDIYNFPSVTETWELESNYDQW